MPSQANNPNPSQAVVARDADIDELETLLHRLRWSLSNSGLRTRVESEVNDDDGGDEVEVTIRIKCETADAIQDVKLLARVLAAVVTK